MVVMYTQGKVSAHFLPGNWSYTFCVATLIFGRGGEYRPYL